MLELVFSVHINYGASKCDQGALCPIGEYLGEKLLSDLCDDANAGTCRAAPRRGSRLATVDTAQGSMGSGEDWVAIYKWGNILAQGGGENA